MPSRLRDLLAEAEAAPGRIVAAIFVGRRCAGFTVRQGRTTYAYDRDGSPRGIFADLDAAALELRRRAAP